MGSIQSLSVVVDKLDILRTSISPYKTDSPLRVDSNAVLAATVTGDHVETVSRRDSQVFYIPGSMYQLKLSQCCALHVPINALDKLFAPDSFGISISERSDHEESM